MMASFLSQAFNFLKHAFATGMQQTYFDYWDKNVFSEFIDNLKIVPA